MFFGRKPVPAKSLDFIVSVQKLQITVGETENQFDFKTSPVVKDSVWTWNWFINVITIHFELATAPICTSDWLFLQGCTASTYQYKKNFIKWWSYMTNTLTLG